MGGRRKKDLKIKNFQDFKNLKKRQAFSKWNKKGGYYELNPEIPTKEFIKGLRYIHKDFDKYDLRKFKDNAATRRKVSKVLSDYYSLINRPGVKEFVPHKKHRKQAGKLSGQSQKWKKFYVPEGDISYKSANSVDYVIEKTAVAEYIILYFSDFWKNKQEFIDNPDAVIKRMIKFVRQNIGKYLFYRFMVGHWEARYLDGSAYFDTEEDLEEEFNRFVNLYSAQNIEEENMEGQDAYEKFLMGIKFVLKFNKQGKRKGKSKNAKNSNSRL